MKRRNSIFGNRRKEANQPLPTPKTPLADKATCKKSISIDEFISHPSPESNGKEHRWSFSSNTSNQNSVYLEKDSSPRKPRPKKRGKRPKPLLAKSDYLEAIEACSSSEESEMSDFEPITHEPNSQKKTTTKTKKKTNNRLVVDKPDGITKLEAPSGKESPSNGDAMFGWSRLESGKLSQKKGEWKKKTSSSSPNPEDFISQSARSTPPTSTYERNGLKKTRSLETPFSRKPLRRTKSERNVEPESSQKHFTLCCQLPKKSESTRDIMASSNREKSLEPSELRKPPKRVESSRNVYHGSDEMMNRSDSELSRIRAKLQKIKSSRTFDESNRTRKGVRSLDRLTIKKSKSCRRMTSEDSFDSKEQPTEETKTKLGGSFPELSLNSSTLEQRSKKTKPKRTSSMEGNQSGFSLDAFPGQKKTRKSRAKSRSVDEWGEEDIDNDLAQVLEKFHKPHESDKSTHADAMQMWSTRMKSNVDSAEKPIESAERRKPLTRTRSARRAKLVKGNSVPDLSLDAPVNRRRKANKPKSRSSMSVCSNEGTFGGRARRKQKARSRSLDENTTWFSASNSDLSLAISEGLESFEKESAEEKVSQRPSNRLGATRKVPSARKLNQSSDQTQASNNRKKAPKPTRSDGSLAKVRRRSPVERTGLNRATSARNLNSSSGALRIDSAGQIVSTSSLSRRSIEVEAEDDLSQSDSSIQDDRNAFEMLEDGLSKSIQRLRASSGLGLELGVESDEDDIPEAQVGGSESQPQNPSASTKKVTEVIDDISEAIEETDRLKRIMEVESVLHNLQETFHHLDADDDPMRSKVAEGENVVLRVRLQQQDELLKKYKTQIAEKPTIVQSTPVEEKVSDPSAEQMKREILELKSKLEEKEKTIEEQATQCSKMESKMRELQMQVLNGKDVSSLERRIWELEKEKTAFMMEISRLHKSNFDASDLTTPDAMDSSSSSDPSGDQPGIVGWLMRPRQ